MTKVLVTGGAGFIGSHIVEALLEEGYEVVVIDNFSSGKFDHIKDLPVKICPFDITDPRVIDVIVDLHPSFIIHQAAQVSVAESVHDILHDENVNVKGSLHVIQAAIRASVEKILFASSAAVYGNPMALPVTIDHPTLPESPYGLTKLTVEKYLKLAHKFYGLSYGILRYSNVFGPRQDGKGEGGVISIFADRILENETPIIYGSGEQTRDFIFVKDVAYANVLALKQQENVCLNISSNNRISINQLWEKMGKISGFSFNPIYKAERAGDILHSILCNEETMAQLEWMPRTNLENGLRETLFSSKKVLQK
ncbi:MULTISPECIES: NAD-dependent epimerase/dehydratase family protein [Bacillaceae]|uniref:NAD-dependent epimerase/dehydratase family protein n=1 Tax=Niallia hominis TaxID=3133173 RepID=A0ABV1F1W6_9BACI|nr:MULTISPECIES: NAD-dependent epimerase/dehydratase family protein [Bacillaceae]MCF2647151.1 NAD-dependent epimerase/dehydratase family protein [Niallia circulans]MCM3361413.1 NAD-dependent epimerase/dehydratase family protein [Niallia sp. MER TA 168]REB73974.1 UDP-glucose 4-epimerase [Cutibacterium acnes]